MRARRTPRSFVLALLALALPVAALAHVGSPDMFLEENAGPYPILVMIEMPPAVPGEARVHVRARDLKPGESVEISFRDVPPQGAEHSIGWLRGKPAEGDAASVEHHVPLMILGLWSLDVKVSGPRGEGSLNVAIPALSVPPRGMPLSLAIGLALLCVLLLVSAWDISLGLGRDATRAEPVPPSEGDRRRGRRWAIVGLGGCAIILALDLVFWVFLDKTAIARSLPPLGVEVEVLNPPVVPGKAAEVELTVTTEGGDAIVDPQLDHEKMMHLIMLRMPEMSSFFHVHPRLVGPGTFRFAFTPAEPGRHSLFADLLFDGGFAQTITGTIDVGTGPVSTPGISGVDADDSCALVPAMGVLPADDRQFIGGDVAITLTRTHDGPLRQDEFEKLTFDVTRADGTPLTGWLEPYMGMLGHLLVVRSDEAVFAHVHPMGNVPGRVAAADPSTEQVFAAATDITCLPPEPTTTVGFPYAFPSPGVYRLFTQVRVDGKIETGVFDVTVE